MCLPSYGAEARGGEVSCYVVFSDRQIKSPFAERVDYLVFFNSASFTRFREHLRPGVTLLYDAAQADASADPSVVPSGAAAIAVPLGELVGSLDARCANMAMLGAFVQHAALVDFEGLEASFRHAFRAKGEAFVDMNLRAIEAGRRWARASSPRLGSERAPRGPAAAATGRPA